MHSDRSWKLGKVCLWPMLGQVGFCTSGSVESSTVHMLEELYLVGGMGGAHGPKEVKGRSVGKSVELFLCFKSVEVVDSGMFGTRVNNALPLFREVS